MAGCCGLYCGLCPRFQSQAKSRCPGCHLGEQHAYCSVYRCCVMKRGFFTCSDCPEFPCPKLIRVLGVEEGLDSFISHKPVLPNLNRIVEVGLARHLAEQEERRSLLEYLLAEYNEGRSMSLYCRVCALLPPEAIRAAISQAETRLPEKLVGGLDLKVRAKAMRAALEDAAVKIGLDLCLRTKKG